MTFSVQRKVLFSESSSSVAETAPPPSQLRKKELFEVLRRESCASGVVDPK